MEVCRESYLAFVHVQGLCAQGQLPLRSTDGALQEALLLLQLAHHLQLGVDLQGEEEGPGEQSGDRRTDQVHGESAQRKRADS